MQFYDELADYYHLIHGDWETSIERQANALDELIGGAPKRVADVAAGVGTQALGLAARGYEVIASDLSPRPLERLRREAEQRGVAIETRVDDMTTLATHADQSADAVIACDNAVPHLRDARPAFEQFRRVLKPGGLCIISVRDYAAMPAERVRFRPFGVRPVPGGRAAVFQVWEHDADSYEFAQYFVFDYGDRAETKVFRAKYYTVTIDTLMEWFRETGFVNVRRIDDRFFQPLITATRPAR